MTDAECPLLYAAQQHHQPLINGNYGPEAGLVIKGGYCCARHECRQWGGCAEASGDCIKAVLGR